MCSNSVAGAHVIFEVNQTKIKVGCQSGRKVVTHNSKSDLPPGSKLGMAFFFFLYHAGQILGGQMTIVIT